MQMIKVTTKQVVRLCGAVLLTAAAFAQADEFDAARTQIRESMAAGNIPSIAVAVSQQGKIVWEEGFGWANMAKRIPADAHTLYSLASISKPITTTGMMILVERGAIDLDRPMNDYLGQQKLTSPAFDVKQATVRRVANHTSGLPLHYQFFYEDESVPRPTMDESIRRYGTLVRQPGENYLYSNFGYGLLEYAMERVSGQGYAEFMRDELLLPLGLTESAINRTPDFGDKVAVRYGDNRAPVPFYDFDHRGASAVFMSAHDLVRFGMLHLRGEVPGQKKAVLQKATLARMLEQAVSTDAEGKSSYGVGWGIGQRHGLKHMGHSGGMAGVRTLLSIYPEHDTVIVVLANAAVDISAIDAAIVHAVLPQTIRNDREFKAPSELLGRWQGEVQTYSGKTPVELQFKDDGTVFARVGAGQLREVVGVHLGKDGLLSLWNVEGDIGTPDARRYPYSLGFALKLRAAATLNGSVSAVSRELPDRAGNALSYWVSLSKAAQSSE